MRGPATQAAPTSSGQEALRCGDARLQGCLGRRSAPGTRLGPRSLSPRAPRGGPTQELGVCELPKQQRKTHTKGTRGPRGTRQTRPASPPARPPGPGTWTFPRSQPPRAPPAAASTFALPLSSLTKPQHQDKTRGREGRDTRASRAVHPPFPGAHGVGGGPIRSRKCLARRCRVPRRAVRNSAKQTRRATCGEIPLGFRPPRPNPRQELGV